MGNNQSSNIKIDYENMSDRQIALLRREQRKEKRYARPHEISVPNEEMRKEQKKRKKKKKKRKKKKRKVKNDSLEDPVLMKAKRTSPPETPTLIVFPWNHKTQSFKFFAKLKALRNPTFPLLPKPPNIPKLEYLKMIDYDVLRRLDNMLRTCEHYIPVKPSYQCYVKLPWTLLLIYCFFFLFWYFVFENLVEDHDKEQHFIDLLVILFCGIVLTLMIGYLRKLKWVSLLEKREKLIEKRLKIFNWQTSPPRRGSFGKRIKKPTWKAKVGLYGSYVYFELNLENQSEEEEEKEVEMKDRYGFDIKDSLWVGKNPSQFGKFESLITPKTVSLHQHHKQSLIKEENYVTIHAQKGFQNEFDLIN